MICIFKNVDVQNAIFLFISREITFMILLFNINY